MSILVTEIFFSDDELTPSAGTLSRVTVTTDWDSLQILETGTANGFTVDATLAGGLHTALAEMVADDHDAVPHITGLEVNDNLDMTYDEDANELTINATGFYSVHFTLEAATALGLALDEMFGPF